MAIRHQDDSVSKVKMQEKAYFTKQDKAASAENFNRFIFQKKGEKNKFFDFRLDIIGANIPITAFLIDAENLVNRPDAIASKVYGNAKYWWIIAMANNITNPFYEFYKGRTLKIPNLDLLKKELGL